MENQGYEPPEEVPNNDAKFERKTTKEALFSKRETKRGECVRKCRAVAQDLTDKNEIIKDMSYLLEDKEFSNALYYLFDQDQTGMLDQEEWLDMIRVNTSGPRFSHLDDVEIKEMIRVMENAAFIVCGESPLSEEDFRRVLNSRGVRESLFKLADADGSESVTVEEVIEFLVVLSKPRHTVDFSPEKIRHLEEIFKQHLPPNKNCLTLTEFKKIMPSKNAFFVERVFKIFDIDGDGTITLAEFLDKMYQYAGSQSDADKVLFLFKVYDIDGDGMLQVEELQCIMEEALRENGLRLPASDVQDMSYALYLEALGDEEDTGEISIDQLKEALAKHEGVLENLTISLSKWLVPQKPKAKETHSQKLMAWAKKKFSKGNLKNNWTLYAFLGFIIGLNIILFITRGVYFKDFANLNGTRPNPFYMLSRACGRTLLFNSTLILCVVLRYSISKLRDLGLSKILPLDHNIYIHKFIGTIIFIQAWLHTVMHLINFGVNVQPDPVRFVQINTKYWPEVITSSESLLEGSKTHPNWQNLGYQHPPNCSLSLDGKGCPEGSIDPANGITACQICPNGTGAPWNYGDWIFTSRPGVFGLINGCANPTGVALIIILTIMVACSLPAVRRSGHFQVFYFTHLLYWAYITLLIFHAPDFWKWVIAPLVIFSLENLYRYLSTLVGYGKTYIAEASVLASKVTCLRIKRPDGFKYSPGDWMFVRIPAIAAYEWHPFTISSAPEDPDIVTLHIRAIGNWTNKLYNTIELKKAQEGMESRKSMKTPKRKRKADDGEEEKTTVRSEDGKDHFDLVVSKPRSGGELMTIHLDGPFGAPASNIFRAEHAVLISTGIGVTPFSSILQSIMHRYRVAKHECPRCQLKWFTDMGQSMQNLRKVDFIWMNRDQFSFEWFLQLLAELEATQTAEEEDENSLKNRFLDIHLYLTGALQKSDMRAVGMLLAMDLLHKSGKKDSITGLKTKTNPGRPNWDKIFQKLQDENKGKITVFYCGAPALASLLRAKCGEYGFNFRKEVF